MKACAARFVSFCTDIALCAAAMPLVHPRGSEPFHAYSGGTSATSRCVPLAHASIAQMTSVAARRIEALLATADAFAPGRRRPQSRF